MTIYRWVLRFAPLLAEAVRSYPHAVGSRWQAANLRAVKAQLRQLLLTQIALDPAVSILDSFPMPVCRFCARRPLPAAGRAGRLRARRGAKQTYYGLRAHLRVCWPGVICDARLVPANLHDLTMAEELLRK